MNSPIIPCVWLDDQADQAAAFYVRVLGQGRVVASSRYPEQRDNPSGRPRGSVLTVEVELCGQRFTLLNGGAHFRPNPSISFFVHVASAEHATRVFEAFAEDGEVMMALDRYPWSERYGWVKDRFGVSWQVISGRAEPGDRVIVPCLMFAGPQHGRAEQAIAFYTSAFAGSRVESIERYAEGEGPVGTIKHGRFWLGDQPMVAMDSHVAHGITFDEGLSFQVMCRDQAELDHYWDALAQGGKHGPCGWLTDRFGLCWQVVPTRMSEWMTSPDAAARDRAFDVMLAMGKLDIAALEHAFRGA